MKDLLFILATLLVPAGVTAYDWAYPDGADRAPTLQQVASTD